MSKKRCTSLNILLQRCEDLAIENKKLKEDLEKEKMTSDNYWKHIVWLRTPDDMKPSIAPCPFCGGTEEVWIDGSVCDREFFVWCHECGAMGPQADSEAAAINAWNKAAEEKKDL